MLIHGQRRRIRLFIGIDGEIHDAFNCSMRVSRCSCADSNKFGPGSQFTAMTASQKSKKTLSSLCVSLRPAFCGSWIRIRFARRHGCAGVHALKVIYLRSLYRGSAGASPSTRGKISPNVSLQPASSFLVASHLRARDSGGPDPIYTPLGPGRPQ